MLTLSKPQEIFLNGLNNKFTAFVGGFGSGKTFVGCLKLINFAMEHPKVLQGYFAPTYPAIRDIFYPTLEEAAHLHGFRVDIRESHKEAHLFCGRRYYGTIKCRSMDNPGSIVGFKIANALVDEIDTLPLNKATLAWDKIIARLRLNIPGIRNEIGVTTTPEGFLFVHSKFAQDPTESYSMVQASTYENMKHLPPDYIDSMLETYPPQLVDAYIHGRFVNLKTGTVYTGYNRTTCKSTEEIQPKEPLRIGMDFNVTNMSAVVYVIRQERDRDGNPEGDEVWHAVDEIKQAYDTPAIIEIIKERYQEHAIRIYPDASGKATHSTNASISDLTLLEHAGFVVYANPSNPLVKDRVLSANQAFTRGLLKVNDQRCPDYAKHLEQLAYDANGVPDKKSNIDHLPDAGTYPIAFEMPIVRPVAKLDITIAR